MAARPQRGTTPASCVTSTGMSAKKRCHHSQTSRAQSSLNPFQGWCNMLLTGLHHHPIVSIPFFLPSNSSILSPLLASLTCTIGRGNHHHNRRSMDHNPHSMHHNPRSMHHNPHSMHHNPCSMHYDFHVFHAS